MRGIIWPVVTLLCALLSTSASAERHYQLLPDEWLLQDSISMDALQNSVSFTTWNSTENQFTAYQFDFAAGSWHAADSEGFYYEGELPIGEAAWVPCIAGPLAITVCVVGVAGGAFWCERRDQRAWNRAIESCAMQGKGVRSFTQGTCGAGASHECGQRIFFEVD